MPKNWEQITNVIPPGSGTVVGWGPDFGDAADDNTWTARGSLDINAIALDGTIIVACALILSVAINATLDLTCQGKVDTIFGVEFADPLIVETVADFIAATDYNLLTVLATIARDINTIYTLNSEGTISLDELETEYTGPWDLVGDVDGNLAPIYDLLTVEGLIAYDLSTIYSQTCQGDIFADTFALDHTKTCEVSSDGDLVTDFTDLFWTAIGTVAGVLAPDYSLLTCQGDIFADTFALSHTKTCACAPRISAESIVYTGPWTCNADIGQLNYELDFVGAATGVNIDITVPTGATSMFSEVWSGGGAGGTALVNGGGGGGGGGFASDTEPVSPGTTITIQVGAGGVGAAGGLSIVQEAGTTRARATGGGLGGNGGAGGQGAAGARGDATNGDTLRDGGLGGGGGGVQVNGGGGGGGSGTANAGGNGAANRTGGTGGANLGGDGGIGGGGVGAPSAAGNERGGGGGGASTTQARSNGARGGVRINFTIPTP